MCVISIWMVYKIMGLNGTDKEKYVAREGDRI